MPKESGYGITVPTDYPDNWGCTDSYFEIILPNTELQQDDNITGLELYMNDGMIVHLYVSVISI